MFGTLFQSPFRQGYDAVRILYKILSNTGRTLKTDTFHTPTQLILKTNLRQSRGGPNLEPNGLFERTNR